MCQITVTNLHDPRLNEKMWLLLGTLGSQEKHKDGWGVADATGMYFKCGIPMHYTTNAGEKINSTVVKKDSPLLGHIRDASLKVPVNDKNAHPFKIQDIVFVHNGKLTPYDEKDFVMEEEVPDYDATGKQRVDKDGKKIMKTVGRSDSLIFFEEFIRDWTQDAHEYVSDEAKFISVINETMSKFYGKFAMVFIINGKFFIVRGRTADLHIAYRVANLKKDADVLGWVINTSRLNIDYSAVLLGNLEALDGNSEILFTYPELLKQETIYVAEDYEIREIGQVKENSAPVAYTKGQQTWNGAVGGAANATNFTKPNTGEIEDDDLIKITRKIYQWMETYSVSPQDIQYLLFEAFGTSTLEVTVPILEKFYKHVLVKLANRTDKKTRKLIRSKNHAYVGLYQYNNELAYPWMINSKAKQLEFVPKK